jgi:hypothetical protein
MNPPTNNRRVGLSKAFWKCCLIFVYLSIMSDYIKGDDAYICDGNYTVD